MTMKFTKNNKIKKGTKLQENFLTIKIIYLMSGQWCLICRVKWNSVTLHLAEEQLEGPQGPLGSVIHRTLLLN